jgi:ferritin-like protein
MWLTGYRHRVIVPAGMTELIETLVKWHAAETQTAVFHSLLALEVLSLTHDELPDQMLDAIRNPLRDLYEMSLDHEDTWEVAADD